MLVILLYDYWCIMNDQIYWSFDDNTTIEYWASNGWGLIPNWKPWNIKRESGTACDGEKCARCNDGASHIIHLSGQGFAVADHKQQSWGWGWHPRGWKGLRVSLGDSNETILSRMWCDMRDRNESDGFECGHCLFLIHQKGNCVQLETINLSLKLWIWMFGHQTAQPVSEFQ